MLARCLHGGFAIEALPARSWGWMDGSLALLDGSLNLLDGHCHHTPVSGAPILNR